MMIIKKGQPKIGISAFIMCAARRGRRGRGINYSSIAEHSPAAAAAPGFSALGAMMRLIIVNVCRVYVETALQVLLGFASGARDDLFQMLTSHALFLKIN